MRSRLLNLKFLSKSIQFKNKLKSFKSKKKKKKLKQWQIELSLTEQLLTELNLHKISRIRTSSKGETKQEYMKMVLFL
jgi:hypothetical protein